MPCFRFFPPKLGAELRAGSVTLLFFDVHTNKAPVHGYDPFSACVLPVREEFGRKLFLGPHKKCLKKRKFVPALCNSLNEGNIKKCTPDGTFF